MIGGSRCHHLLDGFPSDWGIVLEKHITCLGFPRGFIGSESGICISYHCFLPTLCIKKAQIFGSPQVAKKVFNPVPMTHTWPLALTSQYANSKRNIRAGVCGKVEKCTYGCEVLTTVLIFCLLLLARRVGVV